MLAGGLGAVGGVIRSKALSLIGGSGSGGASTGKSTDVDGKGEEESYPEPPSHAVVSLLVKGM